VAGKNIKKWVCALPFNNDNWQTTEIRDGVAAPQKAAMHSSRENNVTISFVFRDTAAD